MVARTRSVMYMLMLLAVSAFLVAGCGGSDDDSSSSGGSGGSTSSSASSAGKDSFVSACGGCHTMKAAGTSGSVGPDLDKLTLDEQSVHDQIVNGGGGMPAGLLKGDDATEVAKYVAENAGG